jgi:hypothetical protein
MKLIPEFVIGAENFKLGSKNEDFVIVFFLTLMKKIPFLVISAGQMQEINFIANNVACS